MITITLKYKRIRQYGKNQWIVYNEDKKGSHTHICSLKACKTLITLLHKRILPESPYLKESARRLLTTDEFKNLHVKRNKPKYYNSQKGVR